MLELIKLEIQKFQLQKYIKSVSITNIILTGFLFLIYFLEQYSNEEVAIFSSYAYISDFLLTISTTCYIIFGASVLARVVIEEYRSKTITLLFTYPISRKKLITAKLIIVSAFIFSCIIAANIGIMAIVYIVDSFTNIVGDEYTLALLQKSAMMVALNSITAAGIGLIPLYFGMKKKSVSSTIISSIILVGLINSFLGDTTSMLTVIIMSVIAILGIGIAYLSFRNIERIDVTL